MGGRSGFELAPALRIISVEPCDPATYLPYLNIHGSISTGCLAAQVLISDAYGNLPLHFEVNRGQTDPQVEFLARSSRHTLFLGSNEAVLVLTNAISALVVNRSSSSKPVVPGGCRCPRAWPSSRAFKDRLVL